ncbi:hypothetical protein DFH27DRAFT_312028 [Peziza echinospora]|nr:hypothetical protein DFH27DRAFT_312028 [Peziza echinospora]
MVIYMRGISESIANCTAYAGCDHLLGPALIFIDIQQNGMVTSHIYTIAGYKYYSPLVMNHTNPAYQSALSHLPIVKQGSELYRGFAITIMKFFMEMPNRLQWAIQDYNLQNDKGHKSYESGSVIPVAFEGQHAADLAGRMYQADNPKFVYDLIEALSTKRLPWMDLDIVIRGGSYANEENFPANAKRIIDLFGDSETLPASKLHRSSTMFNHSRHKSFIENSDPAVLEREVAEMVSTERNYVNRITSLMNDLVYPMRQTAQKIGGRNSFPTEAELAGLFPGSLDEIVELNTDFAAEVEEVFEQEGVEGFAKVCLEYFPSFKKCYEEYMRASPNFTQLYSLFGKNRNSLFAKMIEGVGEQQFKSWLIEPVQRLPRYSLYIDNMLNHVEIQSELFKSLNQARDIITEICSLKGSDAAERSQTTKRLQGMIPSWPVHLKPAGRLITAVDFYEILPPYNTKTSESIASIMLLFPDCIVLLRRPKSTTLVARGILAEVDRPASMRMPTSSKKEGLDLVFGGWCDLRKVRFLEADEGVALWMDHEQDLMDNWAKGGEAGFRKFILMNAYERKARKFIEEVALARQEFRCGKNPAGLVGMRYQNEETCLSSWSAVWGNEYEGYRVAPHKGSHVVFIGEQPGSLQGSLAAELEDGYEIVVGIEPISSDELKLEIHARSYSAIHTIKDVDFKHQFSTFLSDCFIEMNSMEYEPETKPDAFSFNERLLRSLNVSYDGHVSRLTRKLRPPSPVKLLSQVFGSSVPGAGNSSPAKMAKPVLQVGERTKLPPPQVSGMHRADSTEAAQKITLVKDETESLDATGIEGFMRLEKLVEVYIQGLRTVMSGFGVNLLADPTRAIIPHESYRERAIEAHEIYTGFVKFFREEWSLKNHPMVGRDGLERLCAVYEKLGPAMINEFADFFQHFLSNMAPQNRRAFKNIMSYLNEVVSQLPPPEQAQIYPAFVNLLHVEELHEDDINYESRYLRTVSFLVTNLELLFDDTPRSLDVSTESTPVKETRTRRSNTLSTVNVGAANTWKKTLKQVTGSIRGDGSHHKQKSQDSNESLGRVASVLRTLSKKERSRLLTSRSVDEGIGNTATIKPIRPGSSDRPLLNTTFMSNSKESVSMAYPLETIVASPTGVGTHHVIGTMPSPVKRKKRRSSLSDLKVPKGSTSEIEVTGEQNITAILYSDIPTRPAAPAPQTDYFGPVLNFAPRPRTDTGSSTGSELNRSPMKKAPGTALSDNAPEPSVSPSPMQGARRENSLKDRNNKDRKEPATIVSRKPVPRPTASRIGSNNTPRLSSSDRTLRAPPASKKLRERASAERNGINEAEMALQRHLGFIADELRKNQRSRGAYPTAPASVASSTSSTNSSSNSNSGLNATSESDAVKNFQNLAMSKLSELRAKYDELERETRGDLMKKEEFIKDQSIMLAQRDLEIQTLKMQLLKANNELKAKDAAVKSKDAEIKKIADENWTNMNEVKQKNEAIRLHVEDARKKEESFRALTSEVTRLETEARLNQSKASSELRRSERKLAAALEQHDAELKKKDQQISEMNAAAAKREDEYKAELRKRDKAMRGLNKLYENLNLEQDELFKRCNDELESIARAATINRVSQNGEDLWKCLEQARSSEASMRQTIARLKRDNVRLKARIEDDNNTGSRTPGRANE